MGKQIEAAAFIGPACLELVKLAKKADLLFLARLLEMASLEAAKSHESLFETEASAQTVRIRKSQSSETTGF